MTVLAVPNAEDLPHGVSRYLLRAADELELITPGTIDDAVMKIEVPEPQPVVASPTPEDVAGLERGRPSIPREIDRALLLDLSDALERYDLNDPVRFRLRERFWELYDEHSS